MRIISWNVNGIRAIIARGVDGDTGKGKEPLPPAQYRDDGASPRANGNDASKGSSLLAEFLSRCSSEVVCIQETKLARGELDSSLTDILGYTAYYSFASKGGPRANGKGYSGVSIYCREPDFTPHYAWTSLCGHGDVQHASVDTGQILHPAPRWDASLYDPHFTNAEIGELDAEGRVVAVDLGPAIVINVYVPARRKRFKQRFCFALQCRVNDLRAQGRHVILVGDLNVSHRPIDHCAPLVDIEHRQIQQFGDCVHRQWLSRLLNDGKVCNGTTFDMVSEEGVGLVQREAPSGDGSDPVSDRPHLPGSFNDPGSDSENNSDNGDALPLSKSDMVDLFRLEHPNQRGAFTCWNTYSFARERNEGTRIDYILADVDLVAKSMVLNCKIFSTIHGSDHCPVAAEFSFPRQMSARPPPPQCAQFLPEVRGSQTSLKQFLSSGRVQVEHPFAKRNLGTGNEGRSGTARSGTVPSPSTVQQLRPVKKRRTTAASATLTLHSFFQKVPSKSSKSSKSPTSTECNTSMQSLRPVIAPAETASIMKAVAQHDAAKAREASRQWGAVFAPAPRCKGHKEPCIVRVVKKEGPNRGKKFFVCARPNGAPSCEHFEWLNPAQ